MNDKQKKPQEETVKQSFNTVFWEDMGISLIDETNLTKIITNKSNGHLFPLFMYSEYAIAMDDFSDIIDHKVMHSVTEEIAENNTAPTALRKISNDFLNLYDKKWVEAREVFLSNATQFLLLVGINDVKIENDRFCYHCNTIFKFKKKHRQSYEVFEQDVRHYDVLDQNYYPKEQLNSIRN